MGFLSALGYICIQVARGFTWLQKMYIKKSFRSSGENVWIGSNCQFTASNITIGNNVSIGNGCCFQSAHGEIIIGNHVMFGPDVHIHGGNHTFNVIGKYIRENDGKERGEDGSVVVEDDCWIGACAIILKGVRIGRGSVIGAGSIVTKDIPPYSIFTMSNAPLVRSRFSCEEIREHEKILAERANEKET